MNQTRLRPFYRAAPIRRVGLLAEVLDITEAGLLALGSRASSLYRTVKKPKKDGTYRTCFDASPALKRIHGRIKHRILDLVVYPSYLQGGIRDESSPRDYKSNAALHAGAHVIFKTDLQDFYPSITAPHVQVVWEQIFRFPKDVARLLTDLTTRHGRLPQGTRTSTHLANLVLFRTEPALFVKLCAHGVTYSRFIDDITWSSRREMTADDLAMAVRLTYGMFLGYGLRPKRSKEEIYAAGRRMQVHSLVVNQTAALPKEERASIRAAAYQLIQRIQMGEDGLEWSTHYRSVLGRLHKLRRFHPRVGEALLGRVKEALERKVMSPDLSPRSRKP